MFLEGKSAMVCHYYAGQGPLFRLPSLSNVLKVVCVKCRPTCS